MIKELAQTLTQELLKLVVLGTVPEARQFEMNHLTCVAQHLHSLVVGVALQRSPVNLNTPGQDNQCLTSTPTTGDMATGDSCASN
jgi:hypothetical protein